MTGIGPDRWVLGGSVARRSANSVEAELFTKLFELIQELRQTPDGAHLYAQIANGYHERATIQGSVNRAFFEYAVTVLKQSTKKTNIDAATRSRADYILHFIITYLEAYNVELPAWRPVQPAGKAGSKSTNPFLSGKTFVQHIASMLWMARNEFRRYPANSPVPAIKTHAQPSMPTQPASGDELKLQREALAMKISGAIDQNLDFVAQLRFLQQVLQQDDQQNIDQLRELMTEGTDELIASYLKLGENLYQAKTDLDAIHSREQQIQTEVSNLLRATSLDAITGIPNHAAFMRHLEAEIDRAKRHGSPLVLAIIKPNKVGERVTTTQTDSEVLRAYAQGVLSHFRAYDLVARYSDEEFAILLPNIDQEQALSVLRNTQQRVTSTSYPIGGKKLKLPGFSSGLACYLSGETAAQLQGRAISALQQAAKSGPSWIEAALHA
jgi:diguanylate cyclase (GGDEF)-like protein